MLSVERFLSVSTEETFEASGPKSENDGRNVELGLQTHVWRISSLFVHPPENTTIWNHRLQSLGIFQPEAARIQASVILVAWIAIRAGDVPVA